MLLLKSSLIFSEIFIKMPFIKGRYFFFLISFSSLFAQGNFTRDITGFRGIAWGEDYIRVKNRFRELSRMGGNFTEREKVHILRDEEEKMLLIKRGEVLYRYVFYKPFFWEEKEEENATQIGAPLEVEEEEKPTGAQLFFVEVSFPFLPMDKVREKIEDLYGGYTSSTYDPNKKEGAFIWERERGWIIQWIENYREKPYTRYIYYYSKEHVEIIRKNLEEYRFRREFQILKELSL